jgi:peptide/nickel transport system substrate-binding protein
MPDGLAVADALHSGKADVGFHGFGPSTLDKLRASDKLQVVDANSAEIRFYSFQMKSVVGKQPAVRRAVAQLIDRPAIAKKGYADRVTPLYSVIPPGLTGQLDAFRSQYKDPNKAAAAAILKEAGILKPVTLTVGWTPVQYGAGAKAEVLELKRQLEASGLFKVILRSAEWPKYLQLARAGAYDLYHAGFLPDYLDGGDYLEPFLRTGGVYQNGYVSAPANKLLDQEVAEQNGIDREGLLESLQTLVAQEAPVIPVWQGRTPVVAGKDIQNVEQTPNPLSFLYFSPLRK